MDGIPRLLSNFLPDIISYPDNEADGAIRIFHTHIDNTPIICFTIKRGVYLYTAGMKLLPYIAGEDDICAARFVCRLEHRLIFINFIYNSVFT